ncbi:MAG: GAF domain-containing protein [Thermoanaerobaculia bacterium]
MTGSDDANAVEPGTEAEGRTSGQRQERRDKLGALLPLLAGALDVRKVFLDLAPLVREIVPNDVLAFSLISPDRGGVRVQAATVDGLHELPEYRFTTEIEALDSNWNHLLAHDLEPIGPNDLRVRKTARDQAPEYDLIHPGEQWVGFVARAGIRSSLRVPIRSHDRPIGGVAFLSRRPFAYDDEDGALAFRIADHLALALAFGQLAEESRRVAVLAERERQLEAALPALDSLETLDDIAFALSQAIKPLVDHDALGVVVRHSDGGHLRRLIDGVHRQSSEVAPDFFDDQYQGLVSTGSFRIRDLEIVDVDRRIVRQELADASATVREVVASPSSIEAMRAIRTRSELRVAVWQGSELVGVDAAVATAGPLPRRGRRDRPPFRRADLAAPRAPDHRTGAPERARGRGAQPRARRTGRPPLARARAIQCAPCARSLSRLEEGPLRRAAGRRHRVDRAGHR